MTKEELAEGLRSRLAEKCRRGEMDRTLPSGRDSFLQNLENADHDSLITGFLKCSVCGRISMSVGQAVTFAKHCDTADEWVKFLIGWQHLSGGCRHDTSAPH
jgi:hypothetical protein